MAINPTGRDPRIVNAAQPLANDHRATGVNKSIGAITEALANGLLRNMQDSLELLTVLNLLAQIKDLILAGALNPHPIPDAEVLPSHVSAAGGQNTTVTTDSSN